ncbi:MAG: DUF4332 domain-containing protein [Rubripirellula sp.]
MLRGFLRLLSRKPQPPSLIQKEEDHVMLYAQIDRPASVTAKRPAVTQLRKNSQTPIKARGHRERLLAMNLEYTRICSPKRCDRLRQLGIITAGDMACANPEELASEFGSPKKALRILKQYRRAIRFATSVPGMMPRDALLLISIHRRSVRGLASESAAALHRDLERYAESSQGRGQLRGRRIPSTRRLKQWISECESCSKSPLQTRVA